MSGWTWAWAAVGVAVLVIEGIALVNSTRGDTLSEHVWAWIGVRTQKWEDATWNKPKGPITPKWTLRVARTVLISFMVWLTLHFATGGWV